MISRSFLRRSFSSKVDYFPNIPSISYEGPSSNNPLSFRSYNANEMILGKPMREWCRFAIAYWHTFSNGGGDPFGGSTLSRSWNINTSKISQVKDACHKADAAFEFFQKLNIDYYCFHDRDLVPEGSSLQESHDMLNDMSEYLKIKQKESGVKLLWGTANLFSHARYMNGAGSNPQVDVFLYAASQLRAAMDVTHALGGENYVFWGGREGYSSLLNTNVKNELDTMAAFFRMAVDYKEHIGATFQLLIEPKPREPTKHQYDYDAMTSLAFLHHYNLQDHFKLNIEPNHTTLAGHAFDHDLTMSSIHGKLGSIDVNMGDPHVGWDTDQFLMDIPDATKLMSIVIAQGGIAPGGLNFDAKLRRESTDIEDLFIAHIGSMDALATGLRNVAALQTSQSIEALLEKRYSSWKTKVGKQILEGSMSLQDCDTLALTQNEPVAESGRQELFEMIFHRNCKKL